ncbi:MAG TPA: AI-2E family transporter [Gemmatales bacterium]|nr:AI-2E family transporter [Gemmatales bacterium]HMP16266.1 AI-2E family transporter [Gemmatales bacterium]
MSQPASRGLSAFTQQLLVAVLALIWLVLVIYLLREFAVVLKPLFIAGFLSYLIIPAHHWLVERGINRPLAAVVLVFLVIGVFISIGILLYANAETLLEKWPQYQLKWRVKTESLRDVLPEYIQEHLHLQQFDSKSASSMIQSVLGSFFNFLTVAAVVILYLCFLLAERASFPKKLLHAFGPERSENIRDVLTSISKAISEYIRVKTFISLITGIGTAIILTVFGVDFPITWGTLAFLLNFIPYLGSMLATVLPVLLALVQFDSIWTTLIVGSLLVVYQQFLGVIVEPRLAGAKLGVSPLLIILSLAFWGVVWGIVGMLLAVPLLMVIKIVLGNIPATKPVAVLLE